MLKRTESEKINDALDAFYAEGESESALRDLDDGLAQAIVDVNDMGRAWSPPPIRAGFMAELEQKLMQQARDLEQSPEEQPAPPVRTTVSRVRRPKVITSPGAQPNHQRRSDRAPFRPSRAALVWTPFAILALIIGGFVYFNGGFGGNSGDSESPSHDLAIPALASPVSKVREVNVAITATGLSPAQSYVTEPGTLVVVIISNQTTVPYRFQIPDQDVDTLVDPGIAKRISIDYDDTVYDITAIPDGQSSDVTEGVYSGAITVGDTTPEETGGLVTPCINDNQGDVLLIHTDSGTCRYVPEGN